jgi:hypothetical protein
MMRAKIPPMESFKLMDLYYKFYSLLSHSVDKYLFLAYKSLPLAGAETQNEK